MSYGDRILIQFGKSQVEALRGITLGCLFVIFRGAPLRSTMPMFESALTCHCVVRAIMHYNNVVIHHKEAAPTVVAGIPRIGGNQVGDKASPWQVWLVV